MKHLLMKGHILSGKYKNPDLAFSIIMEYCDYGDLFQKITRHQKDQSWLKEEEIWRIFI